MARQSRFAKARDDGGMVSLSFLDVIGIVACLSKLLLYRHRERSAAIHVSCIKDGAILHMDCRVAIAPRSDEETGNNADLIQESI